MQLLPHKNARRASKTEISSFRWYFAGVSLTSLGNTSAPIAVAFAILAESGVGIELGLLLAARTLPSVFLIVPAGAVGDRFSRKTILIWSNLGSCGAQLTTATLFAIRPTDVLPLTISQLAAGAFAAFSVPASRGLLSGLVRTQMRRSVSGLAFSKNGARVAGPALTGVLVQFAGSPIALATGSLGFGAAAICTWKVQGIGQRPSTSRISADLIDGWRVLRGATWASPVMLSLALTNCILAGIWGVLGPSISDHTIGAAGWGLVLTTRAAGLVIASAAMLHVRVERLLLLGQTTMAIGAAPIFALAAFPNLTIVCVASLLAGAGTAVLGIAWETTLQENISKEHLSRVSSHEDFASSLSVPLGQISAVPLAHWAGENEIMLAGGVAIVLAAWVPLVCRSVRTTTCTR